jgi:hypothetical protein
MRTLWMAVLCALFLSTGCAGYRGPGTYPGYVAPGPDPVYYQMMVPPPMRWAPPPYPGGPLFRTQ